jgi:hypothetical protein
MIFRYGMNGLLTRPTMGPGKNNRISMTTNKHGATSNRAMIVVADVLCWFTRCTTHCLMFSGHPSARVNLRRKQQRPDGPQECTPLKDAGHTGCVRSWLAGMVTVERVNLSPSRLQADAFHGQAQDPPLKSWFKYSKCSNVRQCPQRNNECNSSFRLGVNDDA